MTSRERMLRALAREKPDRMPASVHQWQRYHLDTFLGGMDEIEAFQHFGLDAQVQYFQSMGQFWQLDCDMTRFNTPDWVDEPKLVDPNPDHRVVHHTIRTPAGTLSYKTEADRKTTWITEYLIKREEDIRAIRKHMPVPKLELAPVAAMRDRIGDRGILRGFVWGDQAGPWQHACCLVDINDLILRCFDQPDWVHELLGALLEKKLRFVESMKGAKFDLVETGGGAGSSTCVSPKLFEEFLLPYDRRIHQALHDAGHRVVYHTCGGMMPILELIVANGCDAAETLTPPQIGGDARPRELKARIGGQVALIGGIDQHTILTAGTPEQVARHVRETFEAYGPGGGYTMSPSDHFFETPVENLEAYARAARECVYAG